MSALCSVTFSFLYLPILSMLFKCSLCILICECISLFLSLSVVCLFFDTLYFRFFLCFFFFFFVFFNFSNVLQAFIVYLNLPVYLFVFAFAVEVLFSFCFFFIAFVNFSNVHWFSVKIKASDWVERNFFSLAVFGRNLLAGDVHSSMALDRHVQAWQWIGSISLVPWGLLWATACSLEAYSGHLSPQLRPGVVAPLSYYLALYYSYIQTYLNYANLWWVSSNGTILKKLLSQQKHAVRIASNKKRFEHTKKLFNSKEILYIYIYI